MFVQTNGPLGPLSKPLHRAFQRAGSSLGAGTANSTRLFRGVGPHGSSVPGMTAPWSRHIVSFMSPTSAGDGAGGTQRAVLTCDLSFCFMRHIGRGEGFLRRETGPGEEDGHETGRSNLSISAGWTGLTTDWACVASLIGGDIWCVLGFRTVCLTFCNDNHRGRFDCERGGHAPPGFRGRHYHILTTRCLSLISGESRYARGASLIADP
jgi:hypothetical protein